MKDMPEVYILLEYGAARLGHWCLIFLDIEVDSSSRAVKSMINELTQCISMDDDKMG
jgi:hypothetical protein